jgi:N-acetylglucosamine-6-phosphate deacetylase
MIIQGRMPGTHLTVNVSTEGDIITSVEPADRRTVPDRGGPDLYLCEGFFDPQVNGYAGVDFNGKDLTGERFHQAARSLAASGVTRYLPTLITASYERLLKQLVIIADTLENDPLVKTMCPGIHLEGPYISPEDGPRGVHPREFIRLPRWEELERLQEACRGHVRCMTLAPEVEGAIPFIEKATERGIVIGLGHTNASDEILEDAFRAGARLSSHLGNAAPALFPRYGNPIQKQLSMDGLMASIIVDGIHLPGLAVKNYIRAKGTERVLLTTDSMAGAAAPAGRYTLGDLEVEVSPDDRSARLLGTSRLAGSTLTMDQAIANVLRFSGVDLATAVQMGGQNGNKLFAELGRGLTSGCPANLVLFEFRGEVIIKETWINGEKI